MIAAPHDMSTSPPAATTPASHLTPSNRPRQPDISARLPLSLPLPHSSLPHPLTPPCHSFPANIGQTLERAKHNIRRRSVKVGGGGGGGRGRGIATRQTVRRAGGGLGGGRRGDGAVSTTAEAFLVPPLFPHLGERNGKGKGSNVSGDVTSDKGKRAPGQG